MAGISDDELRGAFKRAFPDSSQPNPEHSVLASMERQGKSVPRVLLRDLEEESQVLKPRGGREGRYQVVGEIARGGVGVVLKGRDIDLGRDVAMKVLRDEHADNGEVVQRFVEEAQIGGQLQHPGIIPIYEMGLNEQKRPYFTMKLVKGQTLAARLRDRKTSRQGQRGLLSIFERVCDAMAYAHSRGVVHRDLKPANVIIGAYAEVQVVDWGFAKVLGREDTVRARPEQTVVSTIRTEGGSESMIGSVLGTPAYMPPEQALGQVESLDRRSDVFALGAILCEILTGKPPYTGDTAGELLVKAQRCDLKAVKQRLGMHALAPLVLECLSAGQSRRPDDASVVAERIREHLASIEDRARTARVRTAKQQARAHEERRARRVVLAIAATVLLALVGGGATWAWKENRDREHALQLDQSVRRLLHSARLARDGKRWTAALGAVETAQALVADEDATDALRASVEQLLGEVERGAAEQASEEAARAQEQDLLAHWAESMQRSGDQWDAAQLDAETMAALESLGSLEGRPAAFRRKVAERLEFCAVIRQEQLPDLSFKALLEEAKRIDPHEVRNAFRDLLFAEDKEALEKLARVQPLDENISAQHLAIALRHYHSPVELRLDLRRQEVARNPDGVHTHTLLGQALRAVGRTDEARQHYTAGLARNPTSAQCRHNLLQLEPDVRKRIALMQRALVYRPKYGHAWCHIARDRQLLGETEAAMAAALEGVELEPTATNYTYLDFVTGQQKGPAAQLDIVEQTRAVATDADIPSYEARLVYALNAVGRKQDALEVALRLTKTKENWAQSWRCLAFVRESLREKEAAAEAFKTAVSNEKVVLSSADYTSMRRILSREDATRAFRTLSKRRPKDAWVWYSLGLCLAEEREFKAAEEALLECIRLHPQGTAIEALKTRLYLPKERVLHVARQAVRDDRDAAIRLQNLGYLHLKCGDVEDGLALYKQAIQMDRFVTSAAYLSAAAWQDDTAEATAEALEILERGLQAFPASPSLRLALAARLVKNGQKAEGIAAYRRALVHSRTSTAAWKALITLCPPESMEKALRAVRADHPHSVRLAFMHADLLQELKHPEESARALGEAARVLQADIARDTDWQALWIELSRRLARRGEHGKAWESLLRCIELSPEYSTAHVELGESKHWPQTELEEKVIGVAQRVLSASPDSANRHFVLGMQYGNFGRREEATAAYKKAIELDRFVSPSAYEYLARGLPAEDHITIYGAGVAAYPGNIPLRAKYATLLYEAGRIEEARACVDEAPLYSWADFRDLVDEGLHRELAIPLLRRATKLHPGAGYLWWHLGDELRSEEKDAAEAIEALEKALAIEGRWRVNAHWRRMSAEWLYGLGAEKQARRVFEELIDADPDNHRLRAKHATLLYETGRMEEARASVDAAPLDTWEDFRDLVVEGLHRELAIPLLRRAIKLHSEAGDLWWRLGDELRSEEKDAAAAIEALEKALAIEGPLRVDTYRRWLGAEFLYGLGAEKQAYRAFEEIIAAEPEGRSADLVKALTFLHSPFPALWDPKRGLASAERAVNLSSSASARGALGFAWYRAGDYEKAVAHLESHLLSMQDGGRKKKGLAWLAMSQWKAGRHEQARASLKAAKAIEYDGGAFTFTDRAIREAEGMIR